MNIRWGFTFLSATVPRATNSHRIGAPPWAIESRPRWGYNTARRVILDHLENRYGRQFNTVWTFVRFAQAEGLGLDFTSPPKRPDPAELLKSLDEN